LRLAMSFLEKSVISAAYTAPGRRPAKKTLARALCDLSSMRVALLSLALNFPIRAFCLTFREGPFDLIE
jgi:hypothetical protein